MNALDADERRLIEAAQADPARFVELYDRYFPRVWAFVMGRVRDRAEAEDIVSEAFGKAMGALPEYEWRGAPFAAWLLRIAANTLASRWSKQSRSSPEPPAEVAAEEADVERRAMVFQLVERLPDAQRELIELRYVEGLSLAEAGHRLGRSEGAAKQLHRRALEQLRDQMQPVATQPAVKEAGNA